MISTQRKSQRCKRKLAISSDSEDDKKTTDDDTQVQRQSSRIYNKQHRPDFKLPSRDEIWKEIPSSTPKTELKRITPRKTVNNFTKVYNNYNYDDYEDTSDDESTPDDSSDSDNPTERPHRIKNYHKRVQMMSSSSDEDESKLDESDKACDPLPEKKVRKGNVDLTTKSENKQNGDGMKSSYDMDTIILTENADHEDSDENMVHSPCKRTAHLKNRSLLESDDESTKNDDDAVDDVSGNDDSSDDNSSGSSDLSSKSGRRKLANHKMKTINMFQKLRDARNRKKCDLALEED